MSAYAPVEGLTTAHDRSTFECGSSAQSTWFRNHALLAQQADTARVYVVRPHAEQRVAGFYALAAGSVDPDEASTRVAKGTSRHPIPVVILTRLGVDLRDQGNGLGKELVFDAFLQTVAIADRVGVRALLIHAETPRAAGFYRRLDPAFEELPGDPLTLVLLIRDLRAAIRKVASRT